MQNPHPYYNSPTQNPQLNLQQIPANWPANVRVRRVTKQDQWGNVTQVVEEDYFNPQLPQQIQIPSPHSKTGGTKLLIICFLLVPVLPGLMLLVFTFMSLLKDLVVVILAVSLVVFLVNKVVSGSKKGLRMPRTLPQPQGYYPTAPLPSISQIPTSNLGSGGSGHPTTGLMPSVSYPQPNYPQSNNPHP
jgi:hypothetical protein